MISYQQFQDFIVTSVKQMMEERGRIAPHVLAITKEAMVYIALPEDKHMWRLATAVAVQKSQATAYAFISEAWYYTAEKKNITEEEMKLLKSGAIMPSQHPDRREGIFINFY